MNRFKYLKEQARTATGGNKRAAQKRLRDYVARAMADSLDREGIPAPRPRHAR